MKRIEALACTLPQPKGTRLPRFYVPTETVRDAHEGSVFQLSQAETKHALRQVTCGSCIRNFNTSPSAAPGTAGVPKKCLDFYRVLRMSEGAWLEVCDGKGLLVEAQLRGLTYSNKAFATASANPQQVSASTSRLFFVCCVPCTFFGRSFDHQMTSTPNKYVTQLSR